MNLSPLPQAEIDAQRRRTAIFALVACNLFWGWSFPTMQLAQTALAEYLPEAQRDSLGGALSVAGAFIGWRFLAAAILYALFSIRHQRGFTRADVIGGCGTGLCFTLGLFLQLIGLRFTPPSVSGFLTALVVILVPLAQRFVLRQALPPGIWPSIGLALSGMVVLSWSGESALTARIEAPWPLFGETLTVLGSLAFTGQILCLDRFGKAAHPARLSSIMFGVTALAGLLIGALSAGGGALFEPSGLAEIATDRTVQWTFLSVVIFSSGLAFHLMNTHQPRLPASMAGVLYGLEPVFATLFSLLLRTDEPRPNLFVGGALVFMAILVVTRPAPRVLESSASTG